LRPRLAVLALLLAPALAAAGADPEDKTLSPYFFVEGGDPAVDRMPLEKTAVTIAISGVIADVKVHQIYRNDGKRPISARYVFPASTRAAVHGLKMVVGDEVVEAKIKRREEARRDFEKAKAEGKNASLLEQDRPNVFTMNVANIMPGDEIAVELRYTELLVPTGGVYELVYPTVVGPRYSTETARTAAAIDRFIATPFHAGPPSYTFEAAGMVSGGVPIQELGSPSHKLQIVRDPDGAQVDFWLDPSEERGGDRDLVLRYRLAGGAVQSGLLLFEGADEKFFLLMAQPPARVEEADIPPREYVFVLDVSGSMIGFPLDVAKLLLRDLVGKLRPTDRFNVILFSGASRLLSRESLAATRANVDVALQVIDEQDGGGGTELPAALELALGLPRVSGMSRTFVVVTDGYIGAEAESFRLVRERLGDANVFAFGIGSSVNRHLIEGLARAGQGEPFVVLDPENGKEAARRFREYVQTPVLAGVRLEADGFEIYDVEPAALPDVMADRPVIVHGKWRGPRAGTLRLSGTTGRGPWSQAIDVAGVTAREAHRALPYLWARTRIATLSDLAYGHEPEELKEEIVKLGLGYNLLTRHTSFIAVRHVVRTAVPGADVAQPLPLPAGVSESAIPLEQGDEPELVVLLGLLAIVAAAYAARARRSVW
jgi:Ca-activated chloride channel family protein